jgi:predicted transcriptional regulator
MPVTSIRLQDDLEELLDQAASRQHRSKNWLINQAIREYLARDRLEQQRWQETVAALKSASEGRLVAADQVHAWLESWGKDAELPPPKHED